MSATTLQRPAARRPGSETTLFQVLLAVTFCHMLNDMVQSLLPSTYPILKGSFHLNFGQIGLIALVNQVTASLFQPFVGLYTDRTAAPYFLPVGMSVSLVGLLTLAFAPSFAWLLVGGALVGFGSAVFHPESSRVARMASGGQHGFAQSFFQVGGNAGSSLGPLLAAFIVLPYGQSSIAWFSVAALAGIAVLIYIGTWYKDHALAKVQTKRSTVDPQISNRRVAISIGVLVALVFSKYFYLASLSSYFTFYLIQKFGISVQAAQLHLFLFLGAVAAGTIIGGPVGDRIGRKYVIWCSILGVLPFSLALPYSNLFWTGVLSVIIGLILASAFSAIIVYAQELVPGRVGMISGLFFGLAFGLAGVG